MGIDIEKLTKSFYESNATQTMFGGREAGLRIVNGEGPKDCKIALVGEAPGEEEDKKGRPFIGDAGRHLGRCMSAAGIARSEVYITNVVKLRPRYNNIVPIIDLKTKKQKISPDWNLWVDLLYEELDSTCCNVIVALGATAMFALTGKVGISKWRGSILDWRGHKVIPTLHPSFAMRLLNRGREPDNSGTQLLIRDLKRVLAESSCGYINPEANDKFIVKPSFQETISFLDSILENKTRCGFDIEIQNEEISCISFATSPTVAICIPFIANGTDYFIPEEETFIWYKISQILEDLGINKIGQNLAFDSHFVLRKYGIICQNLDDTMIAEAILYPDFPKKLEFISSVYTRRPYYKDDGKRWKFNVSDEAFWQYNCKDSAVCIEAFPKMMLGLIRQGNVETYKRQVSLIPPITFMEERGILMDIEAIKKALLEAKERIKQLSAEFENLAPGVNTGSPKQLCNLFYVNLGITPYVNRTTGNMTTDDTALSRMARKGVKEAIILRDIRKLSKWIGTYLEVKLDQDSRIRCSMNPVGAKTGRLSSSTNIFGTGTNLQNSPPRFKRFMLTDEEYL